MKKYLVMGLILGAFGCTDTTCARVSAYGDQGHVVCYSGTREIYNGESTGKIGSQEQSDGYLFKDAETGKLVEVSGNCVITY